LPNPGKYRTFVFGSANPQWQHPYPMNARTYMQRLAYLEECIRKGRIHGIETIRRQFDCCDKTARNLVAELKAAGIDVHYSRALRKFFIRE